MITILILPEKLRKKLKKPLGTLIAGNFDETIKRFREILAKEKPTRLIAVGDAVSESLMKNGVFPDVFIIDNKVMRKEITPLKFSAERTLYAKNPAGTISKEAWEKIKNALDSDLQTKIIIDGEEDLLALPAVLFAPENSFVVYGQPREGMVIIKVTEEKRREVKSIIDEMKTNSKD
mgnify:FL=1